MNVRALTGFLDPGWPIDPRRVASLAEALQASRRALQDAGYVVQTLRIATPPPSEMERPVPPFDRPDLARQLEAQCFVNGLDYAAIGPALPDELPAYAIIPNMLAATENVFTSALFASPDAGLSLPAARACADVIQRASQLPGDGFANLRFAALACVPPGTPFFPAAYSDGGTPAVAVATEAAELAVDALREVTSPAKARRRLVSMVEAHGAAFGRLLEPVLAQADVRFLGIDFSLAPYPEPLRSIGTAMEAFGAPVAGAFGSAAAAAFLADCLDGSVFRRTGFCGLFFPVLEDSILAARSASGQLTITDLLLYSTLCGTGLDVLPLPGDASADALAGVLIDLGAVSLRHAKPLTARLMPLPGKSAGDEVHFDFAYFSGSRVLALPHQTLGGLLAGTGTLEIGPRT
jgi:uncharacterized protein (UPF0210 family)